MKSLIALLGLGLAAMTVRAEGDIVQVGQAAPVFTARSAEGAPVTLAQFKGKVVLLDFFATWCGPCMTEMPLIEREIWTEHKAAGLVVLALGREHSVAEMAAFKVKKGFTFPILADPKREIYGQYATSYIPRCYLIGKDGVVKYASVGYEPEDFAALKAAIVAELAR